MKSKIFKILAVILLITASCENNSENIQYEIQQIEVQNGLELVTGNFDQFPELKDLYQNLIIEKRNASELNNKKYYFEIDSSNVVKSSFEGDVFFTIPIIGEINQKSFENLVLTSKKNATKEAYIINYEPDNDYLKRVSANPFTYFTGATGSTNLNSLSSKSCYFITYTVCTWSGHPSNSGIPVGSGCKNVETVKIEVCSGEPTVTISGSGLYSPSSVGDGQTDILQGTDVITNPLYLKAINPHVYVINSLGLDYNSSESKWLKRSENFEFLLSAVAFLDVNGSNSEAKKFIIESINFSKTAILDKSITTRKQLISEINIYTNAIFSYGSPGEKQLAGYLKNVNNSFSDFSDSELYEYYLVTRDLRFRMQTNRIKTVLLAVAESFQPVIEFALWEVGGGLALKLLSKFPAVIKTTQILNVLDNLKVSSSLSKFSHASKYGFKTYGEHVKFFADLKISRSKLGIEVHHLIEKRFAPKFRISTDNMKSIVLTKDEHKIFNAEWRKRIGHRTDRTALRTDNATVEQINAAAREIYKNYPEILKALNL